MNIYIIIGSIIGFILGILCYNVILNSISKKTENKSEIIKGGNKDIKNEPSLFSTLITKLNNFGIAGYNMNNYNEYKTL